MSRGRCTRAQEGALSVWLISGSGACAHVHTPVGVGRRRGVARALVAPGSSAAQRRLIYTMRGARQAARGRGWVPARGLWRLQGRR